MAAQHLDIVRNHLMTHHRAQSASIAAANQALEQLSDLTSAAKTTVTNGMVAEATALSSGSCSTCVGIVSDGVAATIAP
jgi:ferredoxin